MKHRSFEVSASKFWTFFECLGAVFGLEPGVKFWI